MSMKNDFTAFLEKAAACPAYEKREEPTIKDVAKAIDQITDAFEVYKSETRKSIDFIETRVARPGWNHDAPGMPGTPDLLTSTTGRQHQIYKKGVPVSTPYRPGREEEFSLGQYCRQAVCGSTKAMGSGPALVPTWLSANVVDDVRHASVIASAGARYLPVEGPTVVGRIDGDASVIQHTENADDITESDVTLTPVTIDPKMLVSIVPLSEELLQDSPNVDAVIRQSIAAAFATKLDGLGIAKLLADASIPKSAVGQDPALWLKVLEAIGVAMAAKQRLPKAMIGSAGDFIARASQLASTAGSWLGRPPVLSDVLELPTSAMSNGTAVFGDFDHGVLIAGRNELRVEIVRWAKSGRGQHALIAHMRIDCYCVQPKALFKQLKTVP